MKTIFDHIERVKGQPHHIRKRVAFGTAATLTALVALVWLVGSLGTGAFALKSTSFADSTGGERALTVSGVSGSQGLAGAAAAPALGNASAPARIQIIDAGPSAGGQKKAETTIPF